MARCLLSPCCGRPVLVPVDVTAHLLVRPNGTLSTTVADRVSDIRRQAIAGDADLREAYCPGCGEAVNVQEPSS